MQRLLVIALASAAFASDVTPVQKVIQMLDNMKEKGTMEMNEEQVQYTKFKQFCDMTLEEKGSSISEAADKIDSLEADIEQSVSEAERLTKEIGEHAADVEAATAEKANATSVREKGREDFQLALTDYTESIDAIGRAVKALKEEDKKTSLLQLSAARNLKLLPEDVGRSIDAYLSDGAKGSLLMESTKAGSQAPAPKTYEFQSGGVITMLEGLQDKFVDERISLEKEEQKKRHSYKMLVQSLDAQMAQSKKEQQEKAQFKAKKLQSKASSEGDLAETKTEKQSDEKYSADLKATCEKKAAAFAERQKLRGEELEAIEKATGIIASGAVAGSAEKHLPSLAQATALAFLRSDRAPRQEQVARFLQQRASELNSRVLSAMAGRAAADPIGKVRDMIEGLITKMTAQANEEATKNGWCNAELASNKATREEKTDAVESLQSDMDELSTSISTLGEELATLSKQVTELDGAMANATDMRQKESEKNAATVKDATEGQAAVAQALLVLKDFYAKAATATSLVQKTNRVQAQPDVFGDDAYTGMGGESGGVISMLEVVQSDFARLQAETEAAEEAGKAEYQEFMEDSKVDKATKTRTSEHKASKKQAKSQELTMLQADMQGTQKELDAANAYFEKLKPDCIDTGVSYAERKAQREQEVKDLQEALEMLNKV